MQEPGKDRFRWQDPRLMDAIRAALRGDAPVSGVIQDALTKVRAVVTQTTGPSLTSLRVRDMLAAQTVDKAGSRNSFRD